ncbi:MAG: FAD-dependent oxidoreductase, partial [Gemmataceae bacterium]
MNAPRPKLLILGSGFAAFRLMRQIDPSRYDVTAVSRRNHFVYTPLLPSTVVGTVEFRSIVEPLRRGRGGVRCLLGSALSLDAEARTVRCREAETGHEWDQPYDVLAVATGAESNTFNVPGAREHCFFLKEIEEARAIRQRLIANLERAGLPGVPDDERRRLLHFVAVGAGPTGVRFAAEVYDLLTADLRRLYPEIAGLVRVTVVEAGPSLLVAFDERLREYTARQFGRRGIAVRTGCVVAEVGPGWVRLKSGEVLPAGLVLWCAGFGPNAFVAGLPFEKDRSGRLAVDGWLRVRDGVYALGDCACPRGANLPQLAQV